MMTPEHFLCHKSRYLVIKQETPMIDPHKFHRAYFFYSSILRTWSIDSTSLAY